MRNTRRRTHGFAALGAVLALVCFAAAGDEGKSVPAPETPSASAFSQERLRGDIERLASAPFAGRALGSEGADRAASYIEDRFREMGLAASPGAGYRQQFPVRLLLKLNRERGRNELHIAGPASLAKLKLHRDFLPLPFSGNGRVREAPMVFAGYAIHAPELGYDDFAGLDLRGKAVVAFRREPQEEDAHSRFAGRDFTSHASFAAKAREVAKRGGKALLVVTNRLPDEEQTDIPTFATSAGPVELPIPVMLVRVGALLPFFAEQGVSLASLAGEIDRSGEPRTVEFPNGYHASLSVKIDGVNTRGRNVLAWIPGHPDSDEYVIVGAHYDHVGMGEKFSMDHGGRGKLHPGADDNASGVAAMLELARVLSQEPRDALPPGTRGVLLAAFGGEEHGLFGSSHLLRNPAVPGKKLVGVLNFDMVGRLRDGELFQAGLESVPELSETAEASASRAGLSLKPITEYPYNMSDHGTFLDAGIPAILFFTGLHMEYHTPRDTPARVNITGMSQVLQTAAALLRQMRDSDTPLLFVGGANPAYQRKWNEPTLPSNAFEFE